VQAKSPNDKPRPGVRPWPGLCVGSHLGATSTTPEFNLTAQRESIKRAPSGALVVTGQGCPLDHWKICGTFTSLKTKTPTEIPREYMAGVVIDEARADEPHDQRSLTRRSTLALLCHDVRRRLDAIVRYCRNPAERDDKRCRRPGGCRHLSHRGGDELPPLAGAEGVGKNLGPTCVIDRDFLSSLIIRLARQLISQALNSL
jgi:hypothetical protein